MKHTTTAAELLKQVADIQRMEPGKLCIMRQGAGGPYYNLQCREKGKTVSRYIPRDQVDQVTQNTANHQKFRTLVEQYADQVIETTRTERMGTVKKKTFPKDSSWRRTTKSKV